MFRIQSRDGEVCMTAEDSGGIVFRKCNTYDPRQIFEKKEYGPALGTAIYSKETGKCLYSPCLLDRNEQVCSNVPLEMAACDLTRGVPTALWNVDENGKIWNEYGGKSYCIHARSEGNVPNVEACPDTGVAELRFEQGSVTQSSLPDAFMQSLHSGGDECITTPNFSVGKGKCAEFPIVPGTETPLWDHVSNACLEVDVPSLFAEGSWRIAPGHPKIITNDTPEVRAVGRSSNLCKTKFYTGPASSVRTKILDEEFCLANAADGTVRLAACGDETTQKWTLRPTSTTYIDPPPVEQQSAQDAPAPAPAIPEPEPAVAPAPGPAGTLKWLAKERWFWPIIGVVGVVLLMAIAATIYYFIK